MEDFHRCGAIPWHLLSDEEEALQLIKRAEQEWFEPPPNAYEELHKALINLSKILHTVSDLRSKPYDGTREQRRQIRWLTSSLIGRYIRGLTVRASEEVDDSESCVSIDQGLECEVRILKQITYDFVLSNAALAAQQTGHRRVLEELFRDLFDDIKNAPEEPPRIFPHRLRYLLSGADTKPRIVADFISSLTEAETIALHARLRGTISGSVLNPIVR